MVYRILSYLCLMLLQLYYKMFLYLYLGYNNYGQYVHLTELTVVLTYHRQRDPSQQLFMLLHSSRCLKLEINNTDPHNLFFRNKQPKKICVQSESKRYIGKRKQGGCYFNFKVLNRIVYIKVREFKNNHSQRRCEYRSLKQI